MDNPIQEDQAKQAKSSHNSDLVTRMVGPTSWLDALTHPEGQLQACQQSHLHTLFPSQSR